VRIPLALPPSAVPDAQLEGVKDVSHDPVPTLLPETVGFPAVPLPLGDFEAEIEVLYVGDTVEVRLTLELPLGTADIEEQGELVPLEEPAPAVAVGSKDAVEKRAPPPPIVAVTAREVVAPPRVLSVALGEEDREGDKEEDFERGEEMEALEEAVEDEDTLGDLLPFPPDDTVPLLDKVGFTEEVGLPEDVVHTVAESVGKKLPEEPPLPVGCP